MKFYTEHGWKGESYSRDMGIADIAKAVRKDLKKRFPECKFSVTIQRYSGGQSLNINLMEGPFEAILSQRVREWDNGQEVWREIEPSSYHQINHYYLDNYKEDKNFSGPGATTNLTMSDEALEAIKFAVALAQGFNFDDSDGMIDYFHCNFYLHVNIGRWDRPFKNTSQ